MGDPILQADEGEKDVPDVPADATVSACLVWADLDKVGCKAVCAFQGGCGKCTDASQCQIDCEMVAGNGSGFKPCFTWADNDCWQAAKDAKDCDAATQCYKICY
jgi:hypothetical protein